METLNTIIHARWIITADQSRPLLENHALLIKDGTIHAILPSESIKDQYSSKDTQTFSTHAIVPGFINSHTHIPMNYFRGLADDLALMNWLNNYIWPAEKKWLSDEFVYDASLFAMAEMIRSGTTCFNDMYFFIESVAKAVDTVGMRAHIGMHIIEFPTGWGSGPDEYFQKGLAFLEQYKHHDLIKVTVAPHAPYTVFDKSMLRVKEIAEQYDLKINMHVHETEDEINQSLKEHGIRPIKRLHQLGLLTSRLIAIHMTQINEEDLDLLSREKPSIVHCPESNMKLASGICPVEVLRNHGLNVALGTDGAASNNDLNMLGEMRSAAFLSKLSTRNPVSLNAEESITMATLNGAKALGIDKLTGSITVGKSADFAVIQLDELETLPLYHPHSQIVYAASRNQVTDVWVKGKQLLKNRKLTTLDEEALKAKAKAWRAKIGS